MPWIALLTVCFGATGTLFSIAKRATNDGKVGYFFEEYEENQWELARRRNSMNLVCGLRGRERIAESLDYSFEQQLTSSHHATTSTAGRR